MLSEKEIVAGELQLMIDRISNNLDSTGTTASGSTKRSLRVELTDFGAIVFSRKYFKGVEIGRGSGGVPKGFNQTIKEWILNKGIQVKQIDYKRIPSNKWKPKYSVQERSLNMASGAISHSIKKNGTQLFLSGGRADIYSNEIIKTIEIIKKKLTFEIISQIKINTKNGQ